MKTTLKRIGLATAALTLTAGLAACSESDDSADDAVDAGDSTSETSEDSSASDPQADAEAAVFGEACSAIPTDGEGSLGGMADDPVATAASNNPLLKTLVTAVGEAGLVDTLNSAEALTVFAPTDDAFAKIPEKDLNGLLADKEALAKVLQHHVIAGQLGPDEVAGKLETLAGDKISIKGDAESGVTETKNNASVLCGNIPTSNATVYVIDTVLTK